MASEVHDTHGHDEGAHAHIVPVSIYLGVFVALLVGTVLTVWVSQVDMGMWNTPVAMAIAITKAMLVIVFFMHLKYGSRLFWIVFGSSFFWLAHMIVGTLADYFTRRASLLG
jgi:cytochrome c oxidase subunit 4